MRRCVFFLLLSLTLTGQETKHDFTVTKEPWKEALGNHRAVLEVAEDAEAVHLDLEWRRHDRRPADRMLLIISEKGDTIVNVFRKEVNNEHCEIVFGPVKKSRYYFYYLPFENQEGYGFYSKGYFPKEKSPDEKWVKDLSENVQEAQVVRIEARTKFDSFFPMEVIALASEKETYVNQFPADYHVFVEDRRFPIRMKDQIPVKWLAGTQTESFSGTAQRNEYFTFQIGLWASSIGIENVQLEFSELKKPGVSIPASAFTCFNTGGIDSKGKAFSKEVDVSHGAVQAFWIGLDLPENIDPGIYTGKVTIRPANANPRIVNLKIEISNERLDDRGDAETWRHSRLRWLNSTAGIDLKPVQAYKPIEALGEGVYNLSGKRLGIGSNGLPASIQPFGTEILNQSIRMVLETPEGILEFTEAHENELIREGPGLITSSWKNSSQNVEINGERTIESDGWINVKIKVKALNNIRLNDIRLEIPLKSDIATHMMGMGLPGQLTPESHQSEWEGPQDSFWLGNVKGGLHCELRGSAYSGPLLNLYRPAYPHSWYNDGKGGFWIRKKGTETKAAVFSGERALKTGEIIDFEFSLIITPVKELDTKGQFTNRYYHNGSDPWPKAGEIDAGVKLINVHHANKYNPHINYPFIAIDEMKQFTEYWHKKGMKVKTYYTIRELTNYVTEIWALRSLGTEVLGDGVGGGYPWLREHFVRRYRPQWYHKVDSVTVDASILTASGESRWFNYYIEGLKWLVKNVDIDGLYLDDVSYDRHMLKRMRKVMEEIKPGCVIDLHSNTGFSKGPAIQYTEFFPYLDKLWFGESFRYDEMSAANWLVEVSGIPFGHMGDMLHGGGNPWRGMVYGMTVRHPWKTEGVTCDPRAIWKIWDIFEIADSKMIGYWEDQPVVIPSDENFKATAYVKEGQLLIAVASWAGETKEVQLKIDWEAVGLEKSRVKITAPAIKNFQAAERFEVDSKIQIEPAKGLLLIVE